MIKSLFPGVSGHGITVALGLTVSGERFPRLCTYLLPSLPTGNFGYSKTFLFRPSFSRLLIVEDSGSD